MLFSLLFLKLLSIIPIFVGCAKLLQFCNIFVKDASHLSRYQRHEIIKYGRTRLPIFMSQFHQLLQNILGVLSSLTVDEKADLVIYLVPEIETSLETIVNLIVQIKASLEKMCRDLRPLEKHHHHHNHNKIDKEKEKITSQTATQNNRSRFGSNRQTAGEDTFTFNDGLFQPSVVSSLDATSPKRYASSESDLKFVLYMYEVKKMRDIYGRICTALEIIEHKK